MSANNEQQEKAAGLIARILAACGVPGNWAKILAGAIIGGLAVWASLTQTSCSSQSQADPPGRAGLTITKARPDMGQRYQQSGLVPGPAGNGLSAHCPGGKVKLVSSLSLNRKES